MKIVIKLRILIILSYLLAAALGAGIMNYFVPRTIHIDGSRVRSAPSMKILNALSPIDNEIVYPDFPMAKTPGETVWYLIINRPMQERWEVVLARDLVTNKLIYVEDRAFSKDGPYPDDALKQFDLVGVHHVKPDGQAIQEEGYRNVFFVYNNYDTHHIEAIKSIGTAERPLTKEAERIQGKSLN